MKENFTHTHITAVLLLEHSNVILAGEGNTLNVYNYLTKVLLFQKSIFSKNAIHGIKEISSPKGKKVTDEKDKVIIFGGKSFSILSYHNIKDPLQIKITSNLDCEDWIWDVSNNFEYSERSVVAVIFAHNFIKIFDINSKEILKKIQCELNCILYSATFIGYNFDDLIVAVGTVFQKVVLWAPSKINENTNKAIVLTSLSGHQGVIFSITYNADINVLCSTSDDRSVHVWKVNFEEMDEKVSYSLKWMNASYKLLHVLFGHEARVWRCLIYSENLVTVGEDSSLCVWNFNGILVKKLHIHKGGGIWSINGGTKTIVTGGGDSGIDTWSLSELITPINQLKSLDIKADNGDPILVTNLDVDKILVAYHSGKLLVFENDESKEIAAGAMFESYCCVSMSPNKRNLATGTLSGEIFLKILYSEKDIVENSFSAYTGKVFSIRWLDDFSLLTCGPNGKLILWDVNSKMEVSCLKTYTLPQCKQRWFSSAIFFNSLIVLGDRNGNLYSYLVRGKSDDPAHKFRNVHGHLGVTKLQVDNNSLYSTGRNGLVCIFKFRGDNLILYRSFKLTAGPDWIGGIKFLSNDALIYAFQSTKFVVWSMEQQRPLFEIECGGGHRSWDYSVVENKNSSSHNYVCIRDKKIWMCKVPSSFNRNCLKPGLHGREVTCVRMVPYQNGKDQFYISASEDTTVKCFKMDDGNKVKVIATLTSHISSIKAINVMDTSDKNETLMVTSGGRAQMILWKLEFNDKIDFQECINFMLENNTPRRSKNIDFKQVRFMDACIISQLENCLIWVACSDGLIRGFRIDKTLDKLHEMTTIDNGENCVQQVKYFKYFQKYVLISGGTNGYLNFWIKDEHIEDKMKNIMSIKHHQSGINALDVINFKDHSFLFGSGGDDNAITISLLEFENGILNKKAFHKHDFAHSSQITGFKFFKWKDKTYFISTSIDQRIILWNVKITESDLSIVFMKSTLSFIPDISSLDITIRDNLLEIIVGGEGIQSFYLNLVEINNS